MPAIRNCSAALRRDGFDIGSIALDAAPKGLSGTFGVWFTDHASWIALADVERSLPCSSAALGGVRLSTSHNMMLASRAVRERRNSTDTVISTHSDVALMAHTCAGAAAFRSLTKHLHELANANCQIPPM